MKKINNKGMSLIELIISFAIVTIAVVYFAQTLSTVSKLYTKSSKEIDEYVEEVYVYRILEAMFEEYSESSRMGIAGNKHAGFDTIFIYCNDKEYSNITIPSEITSLFSKGTDIQKRSILYPRNILDDELKNLKLSEYKRHPGLFGGTVDWVRVGGKACPSLNKDDLIDLVDTNTDFGVGEKEFKNGNFWLPIEYYDSYGKVKRDVTLVGKEWNIWKKNNGEEFGISQINNYYNPLLKLFVSIATMPSSKTYTYYTKFDYDEYIDSGKEIKYFLTYQIGESAVKGNEKKCSKYGKCIIPKLSDGCLIMDDDACDVWINIIAKDYINTVRVKNFCNFNTGCNMSETSDDDE